MPFEADTVGSVRTMLAFHVGTWDMFLPYEQDFLRELQSVWVDGLVGVSSVSVCVLKFM